LYSLTGTTVALLLSRPLVRAANNRQTGEADFRFGLVRGREYGLVIALMRGESEERRRILGLFGGAARAWDRQTTALTYMFLFTSSWSVLSQVFPVLVAAPHYIAGTITLGVLMQTAQAFQQMTAALAWPIDNLARVAEWRASVERVYGLHEALGQLAHPSAWPESPIIERVAADRPNLAFESLTIMSPAGEVLVDSVTVALQPRERVLVTGDASAVATLFRAMAGLWPWGRGRIVLPRDARLFFMPPRTYLPVGQLHDALCYPAPPDTFDASLIAAALQDVGLGHLVPRLSEVADWAHALTVDEQQRLDFARLLLHRPTWILIQEATDALDMRGEQEMIALLEREFADATVVVSSRSAALERFARRKFLVRRTNGAAVVEERAVRRRPRP